MLVNKTRLKYAIHNYQFAIARALAAMSLFSELAAHLAADTSDCSKAPTVPWFAMEAANNTYARMREVELSMKPYEHADYGITYHFLRRGTREAINPFKLKDAILAISSLTAKDRREAEEFKVGSTGSAAQTGEKDYWAFWDRVVGPTNVTKAVQLLVSGQFIPPSNKAHTASQHELHQNATGMLKPPSARKRAVDIQGQEQSMPVLCKQQRMEGDGQEATPRIRASSDMGQVEGYNDKCDVDRATAGVKAAKFEREAAKLLAEAAKMLGEAKLYEARASRLKAMARQIASGCANYDLASVLKDTDL